MNAVVFDGTLKLVKDHPEPQPGPGEALIRTRVAGICNTDLEITRGYMAYRGVLGHEFVGTVERAPDDALVGRRVVGEINLPCGSCDVCRRGLGNHCPNRKVLGIDGHPGALAEFLTLPVVNLHVVPDDVSDDEAVFTEPLAAACEILRQVDVPLGTKVCVLGDGKLGLLVLQVLEPVAGDITLVGTSLDKIHRVGSSAVHRVLADELEVSPRFDLVVDCTGSPAGFTRAMRLVRPRGTVVLKTTAAEATTVNLAPIVVNEITVVGSRCGPFDEALRLLEAHGVDTKPLIAARFDIDRALDAFDAAREPATLKVLVDFAR
ncbi:MAG TPA: alcohol dehydrogenase catalytic domain-containing protein [Planctomycetota bacterium]|nr:alcohol dehydrogenase catalytic domain-containing protein [Planctomycetota bacterium]